MATISITTQPAQDARIQAAIGQKLGVGTATAAQVKQFLIDYLRLTVHEIEAFNARSAADAGVTDISAS